MSIPILTVDAFTDRTFSGNPAAVCLPDEPADAAWMQNVAAEMNLSETAFVVPADDGFELRWFTPAAEVELCGHATLAAAHVLWETARLTPDSDARFHTRVSGLLTATRDGEWIELDFPAYPPVEVASEPALLEGLGVDPEWVGQARENTLVVLKNEQAVRAVTPDFSLLRALDTGVIITAEGDDPDCDFVSRYFAPNWGIDEDPVTGSAHCYSGPYWRTRLGKDDLIARQVSRRGGQLRIRMAGDRTKIGGQAVTVVRGELLTPARVSL